MTPNAIKTPFAIDCVSRLLAECVKQALEQAEHLSPLHDLLWHLIEHDLQCRKTQWTPAKLSLFTCELVGGNPLGAVPAAAAWNVLHLAAHIFDDLQDTGAALSLPVALEPAVAMNAATALVFLARLTLTVWPADLEPPADLQFELSRSLDWLGVHTCCGQHQDLTQAASPDFTLDDYWNLAGAKAGQFFSWAARTGARLGGGSPAQVAHCEAYGYNLGVLLQLADDWVGIQAAENPDDFVTGKRTIAILYGLAVTSHSDRDALLLALSRARTSATSREEVRRRLEQLGALHYVLAEAHIRRQRALRALRELVECPVRQQLEALVDQIFPVYGRQSDSETPFAD